MSRLRIDAIEGNTQRLDGGAMFGNAPKALWSRWISPDDRNRIPLSCRAMLVREPERAVLFETGIGAFFEPKLKDRFGVVESDHRLLANLSSAGIDHEQIDVVVLSHLHFDHAGGLLTPFEPGKESDLLFPNAQFVVSELAWERAKNPHVRDRASFVPRLNELLEASGRLHVVPQAATTLELLGDGYRFHYSEGHTPGLLLTEVASPHGPIVFAGDLIPGVPWVHLPITMGYDRFPERLIEEKTAVLEGLLARNGSLFFTHDPTCAAGRVTRDDGGRFGVDPLQL